MRISELAPYRVNKVTDILQEGDTVKVKLIEVDSMGRLNLSRRQAMSPEELRAVSDRPMVEEKEAALTAGIFIGGKRIKKSNKQIFILN